MASDSTSRRKYLARTGTVIGALSLGIGTISGPALAQTEISESTVITEPGDYDVVNSVGRIQIEADNVTLNGNGYRIAGHYTAAVESAETSNVTIRDFTAATGRGPGVVFREVQNCTVENVDTDLHTGNGIYVTGSGNTIVNNDSTPYRGDGIIIDGSNNKIIDNLAGHSLGTGISVTGDNNQLRNNTVEHTSTASPAIRLENSDNNNLMRNTVFSNDWHGIGLINSDNNRVIQNEVTENRIGIILQDSSRNVVMRNEVRDNDRGDIVDEGTNNQVRANREN